MTINCISGIDELYSKELVTDSISGGWLGSTKYTLVQGKNWLEPMINLSNIIQTFKPNIIAKGACYSSDRCNKLTRAERAELSDWPGDSLPSLAVPSGRYPHPIVCVGLQFLYGKVALLATVEVGHDSRLLLPAQPEGVEPNAVPQDGRLPHVSVGLTPRQPRDHHLPHPWSLFGNVWGMRQYR